MTTVLETMPARNIHQKSFRTPQLCVRDAQLTNPAVCRPQMSSRVTTVGFHSPDIFALPKVTVSVVGIPIEKQAKTRFASDDSMLGGGLPVVLVVQTVRGGHHSDQ